MQVPAQLQTPMQVAAPTVLPTWNLPHVAELASVVGFIVTVIGFAFTIWGVLRSKSAAEAAESAAKAARSNLLRVDSIAGISGVITGLADITRLHRARSWDGMPERYGIQRRLLVEVRAANPILTAPQRAMLQSAIQQLSTMERLIEEHLARPGDPPDIARLNRIISQQTDNLTQLLTELKIREQ